MIGNMKEILKENYLRDGVKLPDQAGIIALFERGEMLYCRLTGNISRAVSMLFDEEEKDKNILELQARSDKIGYQETEKIFNGLIGIKMLNDKYHPAFNQMIRYYDEYQYLGLSFDKVPYVKVENTTINDYFYLGPFRSRFFLHDVMDALMDYYHLPACPGKSYPCELVEAKKCKGYCLLGKTELVKDLVKYYLLPHQDNLQELRMEKEKLFDELNFGEAENLQRLERKILRYYNQVSFLMVTKTLEMTFEYGGKEIEIKGGMISAIDGYGFHISTREYNRNELYSVEKSELDERWIVFNMVKQLQPEKMKDLYEETRAKLINNLREESNNV